MQKSNRLEFKTSTSAEMVLSPEFFGMSNQADSIQSYHMISSIMKSRFGSLIAQLSSPVSKEAQSTKEVMTKTF